MAHRRLLRAEIERIERRIRRLESYLSRAPTLGAASHAQRELAGLLAQKDSAWARLLDAELKP